MSPLDYDRSFTFKVLSRSNDTLIGHFIRPNVTSSTPSTFNVHDSAGAVCYIVAILLMYSCSILMMIGSFVKRSPRDNAILSYMKDTERLHGKLVLKQDKFRTKLQMHQKKVHRILGPDRAEVLDSINPCSPPLSPSTNDGLFSWDDSCTDGEDRRHSGSSAATTIVCAEDLHSADLPFYKVTNQVYEENGYLSAPSSPTVHQKELPEAGESGSASSEVSVPVTVTVCPGNCSCPPDHHNAQQLCRSDIPEVRIQQCD